MPVPAFDIDDDAATEVVIGHDGKPVRVVRDKCVVRVPMRMRDSASVAGQIARAAIHDGKHRQFGLNRPGYRISDAVDTRAAEQAYDEMCRASSEAWRSGPGPVAPELASETASSPAWHPGLSLHDAEELKAAAYAQRVRDGQEAWKTLGSL